MAKAKRNLGGTMVQLTLPLASLPTANMAAGSLCCREAVYEALRTALSASGLSREYVAGELSRLTGDQISIHHINSWTAESKAGERHLPLEYVAALTVILGDSRILAAACPSGYVVLSPAEAAIYELGRMTVEKRRRGRKEKELWERINGA